MYLEVWASEVYCALIVPKSSLDRTHLSRITMKKKAS